MPEQRIAYLIDQIIEGAADQQERSEIARWAGAADQTPEDLRALELAWERFQPREYLADDKAASMLAAILEAAAKQPLASRRIRHIRWNTWWTRAAAVLILTLGALTWLNLHKKQSPIAVNHQGSIVPDIAAPQIVRATLTLSDGTRIALDSAHSGALTMQGGTRIMKTDSGRLTYERALPGISTSMAYNTITLPRGSRPLRLVLADGTSVLLNTASTIRYPVAFTGKERRVSLVGEAYFDVARDPGKPFIVGGEGDRNQVRVLGTRFNINAYEDEVAITVTLIDGAVRLNGTGSGLVLQPGQQARMGAGGIALVPDADPDEALAWTNGKFQFNSLDMQSVMRQIGRWYDVDVAFQEPVTKNHFSGIVSRNSNIVQILKILEGANVHFKIEGRKITVLP